MKEIMQEGAPSQLREPTTEPKPARDNEGVIRHGDRMVRERSIVMVEAS